MGFVLAKTAGEALNSSHMQFDGATFTSPWNEVSLAYQIIYC